MMIDDVDHECTKVVYNTLETTLPRIHGDWTELTPIRSQERLMSRFVVVSIDRGCGSRIDLDLDGTLMGSDEHWKR